VWVHGALLVHNSTPSVHRTGGVLRCLRARSGKPACHQPLLSGCVFLSKDVRAGGHSAVGLTAAGLACHRGASKVSPMILNMPRTLSSVLLITTMFSMSACASTPPVIATRASPGASTSTHATPLPTTSAKPSQAVALAVPRRASGEVSRAVLDHSKGAKYQGMSYLFGSPTKRAYEVRAACTALTTGSTLSYDLLDAREADPGSLEEKSPLGSGQIICDGHVHANSATSLVSSVQISFRGGERVSKAYAVLVPVR